MTNEEAVKLATWKLLDEHDCIGCKHLKLYSTLADKPKYRVLCDLAHNPKLYYGLVIIDIPNDIQYEPTVKNTRCIKYTPAESE